MGKKNKKDKPKVRLDDKARAKAPAGARPAAKAEASKPRPWRLKARKRPVGSERFRTAPQEIAVFDPENVERVLDAMPPAERLILAADRLQGLAHVSRVQALLALEASELCVGDMAAVLGLSLSATSTMLKQMRTLGFVATRHAGKQTYYKIASAIPKAVLDTLFRLEGKGDGAQRAS